MNMRIDVEFIETASQRLIKIYDITEIDQGLKKPLLIIDYDFFKNNIKPILMMFNKG